nr:hypothetical protein [Tanacetum cinerariifolium]
PESLHEKTDEELTETDIKRMDAYDQAIQTILFGLPEDVYATVDSCETTKEIWERVCQMMKGSDIGEQEEKAKLFNEWEKFTSTDAESIESAERLAKSHDPLTLMAHSHNSFNFPTTRKDQSSFSTHPQQSFPINNKYNPQPPLNQNFMQPPMTFLEDINDLTEAMNTALILFAEIAQPVMNMGQDRQIQNVEGNGENHFRQYAGQVAQNHDGNQNGLVGVPGIANQNGTGNAVAARAEGTRIRNQASCYNCRGLGHIARNCTARPRRMDVAYLQTQLLIA